ncbi:unnamed protein product [Phaeothamnion confervicola]
MSRGGVEEYRPDDWTDAESARLKRLVERHGRAQWPAVAAHFPAKTAMQCMLHWRYTLNRNETIKGIGTWTADEDGRLQTLVTLFGQRWAKVAEHMPGRIPKQCRERYLNHLDPSLSKEPWTPAEDAALLHWHDRYHNKFAEIGKHMPGRSYNALKNR